MGDDAVCTNCQCPGELLNSCQGSQDAWMAAAPAAAFNARGHYLLNQTHYTTLYTRLQLSEVKWSDSRARPPLRCAALTIRGGQCDLISGLDLCITAARPGRALGGVLGRIRRVSACVGGQRFDALYGLEHMEVAAALAKRHVHVDETRGMAVIPLELSPFNDGNLVMPFTKGQLITLEIEFDADHDSDAATIQDDLQFELYGRKFWLTDRRPLAEPYNFVMRQGGWVEAPLQEGANRVMMPFNHPVTRIVLWGINADMLRGNVRLVVETGVVLVDAPLACLQQPATRLPHGAAVIDFSDTTDLKTAHLSAINFTRLDRVYLELDVRATSAAGHLPTLRAVGTNLQVGVFFPQDGMMALRFSK